MVAGTWGDREMKIEIRKSPATKWKTETFIMKVNGKLSMWVVSKERHLVNPYKALASRVREVLEEKYEK